MAKKAAKKRNPNDATFRNINALKRAVKDIKERLVALEYSVDALIKSTAGHEGPMRKRK